MIPRSKVYLCDPGDTGETLELATRRGLNIEVQTFAFPGGHGLDAEVDAYAAKLRSFPGRVSMHGAYYDLNPLSPDPKLAELSRERYMQSLRIGRALKAGWVIFHSTFSPLVRSAGYAENWIRRNAKFWPDLYRDAESGGQVLLIENMYEDTPEILAGLMDRMRSCWVRLCLDVGHVNLYSRVPVTRWLEVLAPHVACLHINDNNGESSEHMPPGEGTIDWDGLFGVLHSMENPPAISLEVESDEGYGQSLEFLARHGVDVGSDPTAVSIPVEPPAAERELTQPVKPTVV